MKILLATAVIASLILFSLAALAQVITTDTLDSLYQGGASHFYIKCLFMGLGLLCFIELRREV